MIDLIDVSKSYGPGCTCPARAQVLKEAFEERMKLAKIVVLDTAGVSSMYANDGGVIVAV